MSLLAAPRSLGVAAMVAALLGIVTAVIGVSAAEADRPRRGRNARAHHEPRARARARPAPPTAARLPLHGRDVETADDGQPRPLVLRRNGHTYELTPDGVLGGFGEDALAIARTAFAPREGHEGLPVKPELLDRLYRAFRHFGVAHVEIVSGVRPEGRETSRHTHGRAIDFRLPGVDIRNLARFLRTIGFSGVGIYPRSGFVHLDVRAQSYYWVDWSRHGRRSRAQSRWADEAARADVAARARGERALPEVIEAEHHERRIYESSRAARRQRMQERRAREQRERRRRRA